MDIYIEMVMGRGVSRKQGRHSRDKGGGDFRLCTSRICKNSIITRKCHNNMNICLHLINKKSKGVKTK